MSHGEVEVTFASTPPSSPSHRPIMKRLLVKGPPHQLATVQTAPNDFLRTISQHVTDM
jgi:hypothetical protein